jgi:hypothetical protein
MIFIRLLFKLKDQLILREWIHSAGDDYVHHLVNTQTTCVLQCPPLHRRLLPPMLTPLIYLLIPLAALYS